MLHVQLVCIFQLIVQPGRHVRVKVADGRNEKILCQRNGMKSWKLTRKEKSLPETFAAAKTSKEDAKQIFNIF